MKSLVVSAPSSGAGKTMITLGLLRALRDRGLSIASAKSGPDYIDPQFHHAASGMPCVTLDAWAMSPARIGALATASGAELLLIEGAMGLFDGAPSPEKPFGQGSTADLAATLRAPVILVLDVAAQAQSAAAVVSGMAGLGSNVHVAGVILNRVGSARHAEMIRRAIDTLDIPTFGAVPRTKGLETPSRHLGLVQAQERPDLETFIENAAALVTEHIDLDEITSVANVVQCREDAAGLEPPGQRVSVARDRAFAFSYPHLLQDWRSQGAEVSFFSPLADETPDSDADVVYLPGGYPELYGGQLAGNSTFRKAMLAAHQSGVLIYGECGGYMVLGDGLIDAEGARHEMLGLLPLETSFAKRKMHLGYRRLSCHDGALWSGSLTAHEFHYATIVAEGTDDGPFEAWDAMDQPLGRMGQRSGRTMGSFAHVIDKVPD